MYTGFIPINSIEFPHEIKYQFEFKWKDRERYNHSISQLQSKFQAKIVKCDDTDLNIIHPFSLVLNKVPTHTRLLPAPLFVI